MIWKIEKIKNNDELIPIESLKNLRAMIASLEPNRNISQLKVHEALSLTYMAEKLQRQGQYKKARLTLNEAYVILDKMNCKRYSESSTFQTIVENKRSWAENHLIESFDDILRKVTSKTN